jgi:hypothetical protein
MIEGAQTTLILAAFGLAALGAMLMAVMRMWQGWLDLKAAELSRKAPPRQGEERIEIAELKVRVRQLEAIAACVDP